MQEDSPDTAGGTPQSSTINRHRRDVPTWTLTIILSFAVLSIAAPQFLPRATGKTVSSILQDAMVLAFIIALPILEVVAWKQLPGLPKRGYWGLLLILVGWGIGTPIGAIAVFGATFLPTLSLPFPVIVVLAVVMGVACACIGLGLLIVFLQLVRDVFQLLRERGQAG